MAKKKGSTIAKDEQEEATTLPPPSDCVVEMTSNSKSKPNPNPNPNPISGETISDYEQTRKQRIKENGERLKKLGIVDLSNQLKSAVVAAAKPRVTSPAVASPENIRRSSRLQNAPPVTYTEPKEEKPRRSTEVVLKEGPKPEFYTEEHEKLLGNSEMPWTLFVDGRRSDGTRIYDSNNGKTCHQCRQKTLGRRTHCSNCTSVRGQFCGDCLMMRYGENVVEASNKEAWICPPCRGICNCSVCRQAKGWAPTGPLYRKIRKLGYNSVAHFLISTKRAPPEEEKSSDAPQPVKRSLPFEVNDVSEDKVVVEGTNINPQSEDKATNVGECKSDPKSEGGGRSRKRSKKKTVPTSNINPQSEDKATNVNEFKSDPKSEGGERSRKRSKKETVPTSNINPQSEDKATNIGECDSDPKSEGGGRSRKMSKKETVPTSNINPQSEDKATNIGEGESDPKSEGGGRSRKRSKKETVLTSNTNEPNASTVDESNTKSAVRRLGRKSKNENVDVGQESVEVSGTPGGEAGSIIKGSDSKAADSTVRRLRLRKNN